MAEVIGILGSLQTFDHNSSNITVFKERISQFFIANKITDKDRMRAIFLNTLSENTYVLVRNLCVPKLPEELDFESLIKLLIANLSPVKSYFAERLKFYNSKRKVNENVADWEARVKSMAKNCGFQQELDIVMRDIFVVGINDTKIMDRLFEEDASKADFKKMVKLALSKECVLREHEVRENLGLVSIKSEPLNFYQQNQKSRPRKESAVFKKTTPTSNSFPHQRRGESDFNKKRNQPSTSKCFVCGRTNHFSKNCAYKNCTCFKCGEKGHLAPQCKRLHKSNF